MLGSTTWLLTITVWRREVVMATISYEDYAETEEILGELEGQYRSEVALYGDAWPGAVQEIARVTKILKAQRLALGLDKPRPGYVPGSDDLEF
jgi:hypothetical protein